MGRYGVFYKLKVGKKEEYIKRHKEIPPEISDLLDQAGYRNYSIWCEGDMLFGYYELEDQQRANEILSKSEKYAWWRNEMEKYVYKEPETGKKEWSMNEIFYHG